MSKNGQSPVREHRQIQPVPDQPRSPGREWKIALPIRRRPRGAPVRKSTTKVRTGCITCKKRKVKCDERKPTCLNCENLKGTTCEGYNPPKSWVFNPDANETAEQKTDLSLLNPKLDQMPTLLTMPSVLDSSTYEQRSFAYWNNVTAIKMSQRSDPYFWEILLPQRSVTFPSIRLALVATAMVDEARNGNPHNPQLFRDQALRFYNLAIKELMDAVNPGIDEVLMTCLAFYTFEGWSRNYRDAGKHMNGAVAIMENWKTKMLGKNSMALSAADDTTVRYIVPMIDTCVAFHKAALGAGGTPKGTFKIKPPLSER